MGGADWLFEMITKLLWNRQTRARALLGTVTFEYLANRTAAKNWVLPDLE